MDVLHAPLDKSEVQIGQSNVQEQLQQQHLDNQVQQQQSAEQKNEEQNVQAKEGGKQEQQNKGKQKSFLKQLAKQTKSRSPERQENDQEPKEMKRQSSQPALQLKTGVVGLLLQEQLLKNKKEVSLNQFTEKLQKYQEDLKTKLEIKNQTFEKQDMKECTFKPQVNIRPNYQQRNLNQFVEFQQKFEKQKKEKIKSKKEEQQEMQTQQESEASQLKNFTCEGSMKIMNGKQTEGKPFYERLYNLSLKQNSKDQSTDQKAEETKKSSTSKVKEEDKNQFKPQINEKSKNLVREGKIEDLLYAIAKEKIEKQHKKQEEEIDSKEAKVSVSSRKVLRKKIIIEFKEQIQQIGVPARINYSNLTKILQQLHFIKNKENGPFDEKEIELQKLMWDVFQGDEKDGIYNKNLLKFILAFNNLYEEEIAQKLAQLNFDLNTSVDQNKQQNILDSLSQEDKEQKSQQHVQEQNQQNLITSQTNVEQSIESSNQNQDENNQKSQKKLKLNAKTIIEQQRYGHFQENDFIINNQQAFKIFGDFQLFYNNRHALEKNNINPQFRHIQDMHFEHKPQLDRNSEKMAKQARERKGDSDIVEHLLKQGKEQEKKIKEKKEYFDQSKNEPFPFKPDLSKPLQLKYAIEYEERAASKEPRFQRLFNLQKEIKEKEETRLKKKEDEEEKKLLEGFTFKPKLETSDYAQFKEQTKQILEIKGVETILNRLQAGRSVKERLDSIVERGKDIIKEPGAPQVKLSYMNKKSQKLLESKKKKNQLSKSEQENMNLTQQDQQLQNKQKEDEDRKEIKKQTEEQKKQELQKKIEEQKKQKEEQQKLMVEKRKQKENSQKLKKQQLLEEAKKIKEQKLEELQKSQKEKQDQSQAVKSLPQTQQEIKKIFEEQLFNIKQSLQKSSIKPSNQDKLKNSGEKPKTVKFKTDLTSRMQRTFQNYLSKNGGKKQTSQVQNKKQEISLAQESSNFSISADQLHFRVNLSSYGINEEISVSYGETADSIMEKFLLTHELDEETKDKILAEIQGQIQLIQSQKS